MVVIATKHENKEALYRTNSGSAY